MATILYNGYRLCGGCGRGAAAYCHVDSQVNEQGRDQVHPCGALGAPG
jgi:hypothetical protein